VIASRRHADDRFTSSFRPSVSAHLCSVASVRFSILPVIRSAYQAACRGTLKIGFFSSIILCSTGRTCAFNGTVA
jgi:hypothetical protein